MKHRIKPIILQEALEKRVRELGDEISRDYSGKEIVVVGVLKGAFIFMADLIRQIRVPLRCDFLRVQSYDDHGKSTTVRLEFDLTQPIENQHVLLVEDIVDTGKTFHYLLSHLLNKKPLSLEVCCLLDKKNSPEISQSVRYRGFEIPPVYLVGYGLDLAGFYRELPYLAEIDC